MSRQFVQNTIFPAVVASSSVFFFLTLPFFFYRTQVEAASDQVSLRQQLQPIVMNENRDLTVRYIGGAMVASVLIGGVVIELGRRRSQPAQPIDRVDLATDWTELDASTANPTSWTDLEQPLAWPELQQASTSVAVEELESTPSLELPIELIDLSENCPTCRVRLPHCQERLFAIQLLGQYYSFFRLLSSQEEALQYTQPPDDSQQRMIVTPVGQKYAVWIWQPAAELELVPV